MTDFEFGELVRYVSDNVSHDLDRRAYRLIGERDQMPYELEGAINDYAEEWCEDNGFDPDEFYDNYDAEDVFMHDNYEYDG